MDSRLLALVVVCPLAVVFACGGATTGEGSGASASAGTGENGDPASSSTSSSSSASTTDACPPNPVLQDAAPAPYRTPDGGGAYPYCEAMVPDGWVTFCPPSLNGHGYSTWKTDPAGTASYCTDEVCGAIVTGCNTCLCYLGCSDESPCPQPTSGTAVAQCLGPPNTMKSCVLPCDAGEQCPDGMTCVGTPDLNRKTCAWVRAQ